MLSTCGNFLKTVGEPVPGSRWFHIKLFVDDIIPDVFVYHLDVFTTFCTAYIKTKDAGSWRTFIHVFGMKCTWRS